jgi:hypothetical protein
VYIVSLCGNAGYFSVVVHVGTKVTSRKAIGSDYIKMGVTKVLPVHLQGNLQDFRGREQAFYVIVQPKDGCSAFSVICPRSLEHAGAVLESI